MNIIGRFFSLWKKRKKISADDILFGYIMDAHGEEWRCLKHIKDNLWMAIKVEDDDLPAAIYLVKEDESEEDFYDPSS